MVSSRPLRDSITRAPDHRRHVAAESEKQWQEALAMQPECMHEAVHHIGAASEVARVFQ